MHGQTSQTGARLLGNNPCSGHVKERCVQVKHQRVMRH